MQWELWDVESGNLIGYRETEDEALALVRELVGKGWPVEALSLMAEDETLPVEALPPAVTGAELVRRAEDAAQGRRLTV
ncbi:MAG: hypothetical protein M3O34_09755 [Chloroflexota bacterium]|nr:hypothetical protein [Chloroflexota bacterium]